MFIPDRELAKLLGFTSSSSVDWKEFLGKFDKEFLEARPLITKGPKYFQDQGNFSRWENCIDEIFDEFPGYWDPKKFTTLEYRRDVAGAFLVGRAKKWRAANTQQKTTGDLSEGITGVKKTQEIYLQTTRDLSEGLTGVQKTQQTLAKRTRESTAAASGGSEDEEPPAKTRKFLSALEFQSFVCIIRFKEIRATINYEYVRDYRGLVDWIRSQTKLTEDPVVEVRIVARDSEYAEFMGVPAGETYTEQIRDQITWETMVRISQSNRQRSKSTFDYLYLEVLVPGGMEPLIGKISSKVIDEDAVDEKFLKSQQAEARKKTEKEAAAAKRAEEKRKAVEKIKLKQQELEMLKRQIEEGYQIEEEIEIEEESEVEEESEIEEYSN